MERRTVPVLIAGGGPVGLALAAELGWRGVPCELVEQTDGTIATPKMNEVNIRTMEFCRRWGIAEEVLNCPFPADHPMDVVFVTAMNGFELGRLERPARKDQHPTVFSREHLQVCSQTWFDPMLLRLARSFPHVRVRHRCRLESFRSEADGVVVELVDFAGGRREAVRASYLVAADGANSGIRQALGIGMSGPGVLGHPVHMFFRAPGLMAWLGRRPGTFFFLVDGGGLWANLRIIDPVNAVWRLMALDAGGALTPEAVPRAAFLKRALGCELEVEWLGVSVWTRRGMVADSFRNGRVFLIGDAVHQMSPTGALGMNTGIGDAVDLGWKLAAVLQGWGDTRLLDSYEAERRPVAVRNVRMATDFYLEKAGRTDDVAAVADDGTEGDAVRLRIGKVLVEDVGRMFRTVGLQIGYRYEDSPICVPDGTAPPPDGADIYIPSTWPGARAPHVFLSDGRSIHDLFGRGFVLLDFSASGSSFQALSDAAARRGMPLHPVALNEPEAQDLYARRLVLVRPDGHVAWRGDVAPDDPLALIDCVRGAG